MRKYQTSRRGIIVYYALGWSNVHTFLNVNQIWFVKILSPMLMVPDYDTVGKLFNGLDFGSNHFISGCRGQK